MEIHVREGGKDHSICRTQYAVSSGILTMRILPRQPDKSLTGNRCKVLSGSGNFCHQGRCSLINGKEHRSETKVFLGCLRTGQPGKGRKMGCNKVHIHMFLLLVVVVDAFIAQSVGPETEGIVMYGDIIPGRDTVGRCTMSVVQVFMPHVVSAIVLESTKQAIVILAPDVHTLRPSQLGHLCQVIERKHRMHVVAPHLFYLTVIGYTVIYGTADSPATVISQSFIEETFIIKQDTGSQNTGGSGSGP